MAEPNGQNTVQLHRLASLRLHQALIQNHNKTWTSQSEVRHKTSFMILPEKLISCLLGLAIIDKFF